MDSIFPKLQQRYREIIYYIVTAILCQYIAENKPNLTILHHTLITNNNLTVYTITSGRGTNHWWKRKTEHCSRDVCQVTQRAAGQTERATHGS